MSSVLLEQFSNSFLINIILLLSLFWFGDLSQAWAESLLLLCEAKVK